MVSSVGYGTASTPSTHRTSVSGEASAAVAQSTAGSAIGNGQKDSKQDAATQAAQPGVTVSISPAGAAAVSRMQRADSRDQTSNASANASVATDADMDADTDTGADTADIDGTDGIGTGDTADDVTAGDDATPSDISPVKAFAYGALGLERPDQPKDERNSFYSAGKWLAAGLTIGGLISLLV
ncbi:hypothetical protein G3N95_27215 [Paraburkholderia sp. Tr-20389]|uniref:hypothetical protein n=1 Tax=Paraburkholderia sp. Tr-20389 TaxID=2703903 RepID=UPI00197E52CA|nr:hypothetical protein [Paraburkholderia sp. Tr-20389]MBN3756655.1 hypothetical protein [Paraburkholderia sp. Tr-20389]